ncbi:plasmid mobilization protein [Kitasatospora aureofaciens]|uniref:plasmid mobilization protein n=1 Tax=Kitasatospora aureofaciens TaxID=1894 RepID=UPI0033C9F5AC
MPEGVHIPADLPRPRRRPRTAEARTVQLSVRLTPSAMQAIRERAATERLTPAGFVANAALTAALAAEPVGRPDSDPRRPLVEALDRIADELREASDTARASADVDTAVAALALLPALGERTHAALDAVMEAA